MKDAIESAYTLDKVNKSSDCLKVFMAPEFFFRGTKGAYSLDTTSSITESLREVVKDPKYKDWFLVQQLGLPKMTKALIDHIQFTTIHSYKREMVMKKIL